MKFMWIAAPVVAMSLPVAAEDLVNKTEFDLVAKRSEDTGFAVSLAQTARLLDFCGKKTEAKEVRDYLQPVTVAVSYQTFKDVSATEASKQNMRGMFLSRQISAAMASEMATMGVLEQLAPVEGAQKSKLCKSADEGYAMVVKLRANAKAAGQNQPK